MRSNEYNEGSCDKEHKHYLEIFGVRCGCLGRRKTIVFLKIK